MTTVTKDTQANQLTKDGVSHILKRLQEKKLRLFAYKINGRYLCRIADINGNIVSVASRYSLESAVKVAVGNLQA